MLILTRRVGESIMIGDDITVTVVEAGRDHVRIGIGAPRSVDVHRQEIYQLISQENEAARGPKGEQIATGGSAISAKAMPRRPKSPPKAPKKPADD